MKIWLLTVIIMILSGCVTSTKKWTATGGSRADATVQLSYEYSTFERVKTNDNEAINLAVLRCKAWGYYAAEAFGGFTQHCTIPGGFGGCQQFLVTKQFQCLGIGDANSTEVTK